MDLLTGMKMLHCNCTCPPCSLQKEQADLSAAYSKACEHVALVLHRLHTKFVHSCQASIDHLLALMVVDRYDRSGDDSQ